MPYYANLVRLENLFKKNYNLISFAFSGEAKRFTDKPKDKPKYRHPEIILFSDSKSESGDGLVLFRNYEINGAAHFAVTSHGEKKYVRLSKCYYFTPAKSFIFFNKKDFQKGKFDSLHYWFFINTKYKSAVKVDWQGLKGELNPAETALDQLKVDLDTVSPYVTKYTLDDVPFDYKHPINFKTQKNLFPYRIVGSNKRKVILNRADGKTCEFVSLKQFYERLSHFKVKFNIGGYKSLKSMLSQKKTMVSKNGRYRMSFEKIDGVWVFSAFSKSRAKKKTVCTVCDDMAEEERRMEEEGRAKDEEESKFMLDIGLEWLTPSLDGIPDSPKYTSPPAFTSPDKIMCPYHYDPDGKPLLF